MTNESNVDWEAIAAEQALDIALLKSDLKDAQQSRRAGRAGEAMSVSCKMRSGAQIGVGLLPGRKRIALYTVRGCHLVVLAWFCSETDAADFCRIMWNVTYPDAEPYSEPVSAALAAPEPSP